MTDLPTLGAALNYKELPAHIDWLVDGSRDLELQGFHRPEDFADDWSPNVWKPRAAEVRRQLASHKGRKGMHGTTTVPLASNDLAVRSLAQERLNHCLDVCEEIELTQIVIHSPYIHWDQENLYRLPGQAEAKLGHFIATLEPIVARAEQLGVELVVENIEDRDPAIRGNIVSHFSSPSLKLSVDTGHAYYANRMGGAPSIDRFIRVAGEDLAHVHLQDADGHADRHWAIGDGSTPWRAVFEELARLSSSPRLIIEIRNKADVRRSAVYLIALGLAQ